MMHAVTNNFFFIMIGISLCSLAMGCINKDKYAKSIDEIEEFSELFEVCYSGVGRFQGSPGPLIWHSKAVVAGNYVILMKFKVKNGEKISEAEYTIYRYDSCKKINDIYIANKEVIKILSEKEWRDLKKPDELYSKFIDLSSSQELEILEEYIKSTLK